MVEQQSKTCCCGFDRNHKHVDCFTKYSWIGWTLFCIGMSACPIQVEYRCTKCNTILETITDPQRLKKFVGK